MIKMQKLGYSRGKRLFVVSTEGDTEYQYLKKIQRISGTNVDVFSVGSSQRSSPGYVLKRMQRHLGQYYLRKTDQAWVVIDKDQWKDEEFGMVASWADSNVQYAMALSNPCFELWLLLHFEDCACISSADCKKRLKKYIPGYTKRINEITITKDMVRLAIARARRRDAARDKTKDRAIDKNTDVEGIKGWYDEVGVTRMYRRQRRCLRASAAGYAMDSSSLCFLLFQSGIASSMA